MGFTDGIEVALLPELSSGNYVSTGSKSFAGSTECPWLIELNTGNYVSSGAKAFSASYECPWLIELGSFYVGSGAKSFSKSANIYVSVLPVIPGDDSFEIIVGLYLDFDARPKQGREPLTVQFNNLSSEYFTQWIWDFGDGESDIALNPSHTYKKVGGYDVSLRAKLFPDWYVETKRR